MVLTTSFNISVLTNEQKWAAMIDEIRNGNPPILGETFPLTLTDGTEIEMIAVDIATNGDVTFGAGKSVKTLAFLSGATSTTLPVAWSSSTIRDYCKNTFSVLIPSSIRNEIKNKTQRYAKITGSTSGVDGGSYEIEEVTDSIWIPAYYQIYANTYPNQNYIGKGQVDGQIIALYTTGDTTSEQGEKRKNLSSSFTATVAGKGANFAANVMASNAINSSGQVHPNAGMNAATQLGVVPHFIIGAQ